MSDNENEKAPPGGDAETKSILRKANPETFRKLEGRKWIGRFNGHTVECSFKDGLWHCEWSPAFPDRKQKKRAAKVLANYRRWRHSIFSEIAAELEEPVLIIDMGGPQQ